MKNKVGIFLVCAILQVWALPLLADGLTPDRVDGGCQCRDTENATEVLGVQIPELGDDMDVDEDAEPDLETQDCVYRMVLEHAEGAIERDLYALIHPETPGFVIEGYQQAASDQNIAFQPIWENANYSAILAAVRLYGDAMRAGLPHQETLLDAEQMNDGLAAVAIRLHALNGDAELNQYDPRERLVRSLLQRYALTYAYAHIPEMSSAESISRIQECRLFVRVLHFFQLDLEERISLCMRRQALDEAWEHIQESLEHVHSRRLRDIPWYAFALEFLDMNTLEFSMLRMRLDYAYFEDQGPAIMRDFYNQGGLLMHPRLPTMADGEIHAHPEVYKRVVARSFLQFSAMRDEIDGRTSQAYLGRAIIHLVLSKFSEIRGDAAAAELYSDWALEHFIASLREAPRQAMSIVVTSSSLRNGTHAESVME